MKCTVKKNNKMVIKRNKKKEEEFQNVMDNIDNHHMNHREEE